METPKNVIIRALMIDAIILVKMIAHFVIIVSLSPLRYLFPLDLKMLLIVVSLVSGKPYQTSDTRLTLPLFADL